MVETLSSLPSGWINARLEELVSNPKTDLVDGPFGSNLKSNEYVDSGVPVLKIQNIKANRFVRKKLSYVTPEKATKLSRHSFVAGDLMITKLGEPLGLCCKVPSDLAHGIFVADLMRLRPCDAVVDPTFLLHCINSDVVQNQFKEITKGTTRQRVNLTIVRSIEIPLPPMAEQHRIVAKIEELFSELDKGIESLKTAQAQLKVYRQALLKHAFEGKLTAQWRADNPDKLDTTEALLERIQRERTERYQQQLADWEAAGKQGSKPKVPKPLQPLTTEERAELPALPDDWLWVRLGDLASIIAGYAFEKAQYSKSGVRLFQIANVVFGGIDWDKTVFLPEEYWDKYTELRLLSGDVVMALNRPLLGDDLKIGRLGANDSPALLYQRVGKFVTHNEHVSDLIYWYLRSPQFIKRLKSELRGVNIPFINQTRLMEYPVPLFSFSELSHLVSDLEQLLFEADQLSQVLDVALRQSEVLRQSILKKAFSGQLVPQDPTDEPAYELLARIKAEASAAPKNKKARK